MGKKNKKEMAKRRAQPNQMKRKKENYDLLSLDVSLMCR